MQLFVSAVGSARFLECRCRLLSRLTGPTIPTVNVCHALVACSPFGLGVRMPVGDIADLPVILGVNAEVQFRPGSVVAATSPDFPVTYYGTVNPCANMAIMARIGVAFGR